MRSLPVALRWYLYCLYGCAGLVFLLSFYGTASFSINLLKLLLFIVLITVATIKVIVYKYNVSQTTATAILVATSFIFQPVYVCMVCAASDILAGVSRKNPWYKIAFNASCSVIVYGLISLFLENFPVSASIPSIVAEGIKIAAVLIIYAVIMPSLFGILVSCLHERPFWKSWQDIIAQLNAYDLSLVPYGLVLGWLWNLNPWYFFIGLFPLFAIQRSFMVHAGLIHEQESTALLARQQRQVQEAMTTLLSSKDVHSQLDMLLKHLTEMFPISRANVLVWDEQGNVEQIVTHSGDGPELPIVSWSTNLQRVCEAGRLVWLDHEFVTQATDGRPVALVPLVTADDTVGCLVLVGDHSFVLDAQGERLIETFAAQAALAIYQARLINRLKTSQIQVVQSERLAAIGTLAAGVAHEFNNLLAGISGVAQLALLDNDPDIQRESLDTVVKAAQQGGSITRGLLTFARHLEPKHELADVSNAIDPVLSMLQAEFRRDNIRVVRHINAVPALMCDIGMLAQVMLNLVTNAIDAMQPNGGTLTVLLDEIDGHIRLAVSDTGIGIPEDIRDRIFEPFVTTKTSNDGKLHGGTGLGLAISYGIIRDHGGTIDVTSQVGVGTTMCVRLPLSGTSAPQPGAAQKSPEPLRMIIVDDEPLIAKTLHTMLTREGHHAQWFTEPQKALDAIRQQGADVIFADLGMPHMDGMTLLQHVRKQAPEATQIVVTGQVDRPQLEQVRASGVDAIIEKPFSLDAIRAVVHTVRLAHS